MTAAATKAAAGGSKQNKKAEAPPPPPPRLSRTTACLPIAYGSAAFYLGKKADEFQTHEWTLYLRGPNHQEDLSPVISKVVFHLHASFAQPTRELTEPPYEVTERGWGEFEAQIRIVWKDESEQPTLINHGIKLYPPGAVPNSLPTEPSTVPVVAEFYDEVVFTNPSEPFFRQLQRVGTNKVDCKHKEHVPEYYTDAEDFNALLEAQKFLQQELAVAKEQYAQVTRDLAAVDSELQTKKAQMESSAASASSSNNNTATKKSSSSSSKAAASSASAKRRAPPTKKQKTSSSS